MRLIIAILNFFSGLVGKSKGPTGTPKSKKIDDVVVPKDNYPLF